MLGIHYKNKQLLDCLDGPLSSLALNCFQLPFFYPTQESYCEYHVAEDHENWMQQLALYDSNMKLRDCVIPGTHDSASYSIPFQPFAAAAQTQNWTVAEQLRAGVRYLDLRVAASKRDPGTLSIWHGCLEGGHLEGILQEIHEFATQHAECIIIEIVPEYGRDFDKDQKLACLDLLSSTFDKDMCIGNDVMQSSFRDIPLSELLNVEQDAKSKIMFFLHNRFFEGEDLTKEDIFEQGYKEHMGCGSDYFRNPWNNTRDIDELLSKNLDTVQKFAKHKGKLLCNQFVVTPGVSDASDIWYALVGTNSLRPVSWACRLYQGEKLDQFLRQNASEAWNICAMDFVDLCPYTVDLLLSLNWNTATKMQLQIAVVEAGNGSLREVVTSEIQNYICRDSALYLIDPVKDLNIPEEYKEDKTVTLTVGYSVQSDEGPSFRVATIPLHGCPVVLSPYCQNEDIDVVILEGDFVGVVKGKQIYNSAEEVDESCCGSKLQCTMNGTDECEFAVVG